METKTYKLDSLCEITSSKRIFYSEYTESGIPFFRSKEIIDLFNKNNIVTELFISENRYNEIKNKFGVPEEDDMLLTSVGSIGIPYLVKSSDKFYFKDGNLTWFRKYNRKLIDPSYLYQWVISSVGKETLTRLSMGAAQPALTISRLKNLSINIPSISVQQKIASILSAYDRLIENNTRRIRLLEQMAENLYKEWFVRFRFPEHEKVEMVNGLPKGWKVEKLGEYANISTGKCNREDAEEDGIYPLFDRSQEIKKSSKWIKDCEAIIVPGEGTSFIPRYYKGKFNLHQRCYCIEPTIKDIGFYLFYSIMLNRKYFLSVATGATVPSLRQNNFTKMKLVIAELELVKKYNKIASTIALQIDRLKEQNTLLTHQRDLLLPRLMSGKLEVKS